MKELLEPVAIILAGLFASYIAYCAFALQDKNKTALEFNADTRKMIGEFITACQKYERENCSHNQSVNRDEDNQTHTNNTLKCLLCSKNREGVDAKYNQLMLRLGNEERDSEANRKDKHYSDSRKQLKRMKAFNVIVSWVKKMVYYVTCKDIKVLETNSLEKVSTGEWTVADTNRAMKQLYTYISEDKKQDVACVEKLVSDALIEGEKYSFKDWERMKKKQKAHEQKIARIVFLGLIIFSLIMVLQEWKKLNITLLLILTGIFACIGFLYQFNELKNGHSERINNKKHQAN